MDSGNISPKQYSRKWNNLFFFYFPDEFRSKVACENERIQLKCNPNSRVAVYSASFGRTEYESIQCPQPQGVPEESTYFITLFSIPFYSIYSIRLLSLNIINVLGLFEFSILVNFFG